MYAMHPPHKCLRVTFHGKARFPEACLVDRLTGFCALTLVVEKVSGKATRALFVFFYDDPAYFLLLLGGRIGPELADAIIALRLLASLVSGRARSIPVACSE